MVRAFLTGFLFFSMNLHADIFDFVSGKDSDTKMSSLLLKLKKIEIKDGPEFEDIFNQLVKGIEHAVEEEKLFCSGESVNSKGKTLPQNQKQYCMRELKKQYLEATSTIFDMKKKYLTAIHDKHVRKLTEIENKLKSDIEKNF
jgi:hypothetical protein